MFVVTIEDAIAIHRCHQQGGDDAALVEARRRWPGVAESALGGALDRVLRVKVPMLPEALKCDASAAEVERLRQLEREREPNRRVRVRGEVDA